MIISFTGSRPNSLGGYKLPNPTYNHVCQQLEKALVQFQPTKVLSGMALGVDSWGAYIAYKLGISFDAVIPFKGQELAWPAPSQKTYHQLLSKAQQVIIVSPGDYSAQKMQIRNEYLVDHCDLLLAVIDPTKTHGGTYNCIQYAESKQKRIFKIDPRLPSAAAETRGESMPR